MSELFSGQLFGRAAEKTHAARVLVAVGNYDAALEAQNEAGAIWRNAFTVFQYEAPRILTEIEVDKFLIQENLSYQARETFSLCRDFLRDGMYEVAGSMARLAEELGFTGAQAYYETFMKPFDRAEGIEATFALSSMAV